MSDVREPIRYDPTGAFLDATGISRQQLDGLAPALAAAWQEVTVTDVDLLNGGAPIPVEKDPLDAAFYQLPERLRQDYDARGTASELGKILTAADRLARAVDRVVVLGIGGSYMGARALMDACCHPYYNELPRDRRGNRPRVYFEGNNVDNDAANGLRDLLGVGARADAPDDPWAIVVISKSGGTIETAVAFRQLLALLREAVDGDSKRLGQLIVPVTGDEGKLRDLAAELDCLDQFSVPNGVGGRFSVLSPVGLLPAAILGLDVVKLLDGAMAMNEHFQSAPLADNVVLQYVGVSHLLETQRGATIRVLSAWSKALESVGLWYDQLLAESLGKQKKGATPITAVNTRDLHSRAQQHQEGRFDKLHTNLIVDQWRTRPLKVGPSELNQDDLNQIADKTLPDLMDAAIKGTNQAYREGGRPTANLHLPAVDEYHLGQFFQMMMLATVVEGRLIGVNPYGQPGVQLYKRKMKEKLGMRDS